MSVACVVYWIVQFMCSIKGRFQFSFLVNHRSHTQAPRLAYLAPYLARTQKTLLTVLYSRYNVRCTFNYTLSAGMISTLRVLYILQLYLQFFRSKDDLPWILVIPSFKG